AGPLRRAPAAFAGNDLKTLAVAVRAEQDRLEHAALGNRIGELVDRFLSELDPRLVRIRPDAADLDLAHAATGRSRLIRRRCRPGIAEQRRKALAQPPVALRAHAASATCGNRPISSRA